MKKRAVILDCDPGIDDFFAILMAAAMPQLDLRAITVVAGNFPLEITAQNALAIAERYQIAVPVAKGASKPLNAPLRTAENAHGINGLGGLVLPKPQGTFAAEHAWDVIYKEAVRWQGQLEVIAVGPLTNLAIAMRKHPDLAALLHRIVFMGGSTGKGNVTPYAEFNVYTDPLAADIVLQAGVPLAMIGLNVTMSVHFTADKITSLTGSSTVSRDCRFLLEGRAAISKDEGDVLHDLIAVAYAADPAALKCQLRHVEVERRSGPTFGRTVVMAADEGNDTKPQNCMVAVGSNSEKLFALFEQTVQYYAKKEVGENAKK